MTTGTWGGIGAKTAAIEKLTRYFAVELAPLGVRANAGSPGLVKTEAEKHFRAIQDESVFFPAQLPPLPPTDSASQAVDHLVAFLCSPESSMIRGQTILIDGSYNLHGDRTR
jgi:enoyl-[acyl-carrier protein] reductase III